MDGRFGQKLNARIEQILKLNPEDRPEQIAQLVHKFQVDKAGAPYIGHPRRVSLFTFLLLSELVGRYSQAEISTAVQAAWLHDVIEDSGKSFPQISKEDLAKWGVAAEVIEVVDLLTKKAPSLPEPSEDPYYQAIKAHKLARMVKLADLADNCNGERVARLNSGFSKIDYYLNAVDYLDLDDAERFLFNYRIDLPAEITQEIWDAGLNVDFVRPNGFLPVIKGRMNFSQMFVRGSNKRRAEETGKHSE